MTQHASRAEQLFSVIGVQPASRAASGRYLRSLPVRPGVRYWATSQPRFEEDYLGLQFYGEGRTIGRRLATALERAGFAPRNPQSNQDTYAKAVRFDRGGGIDAPHLLALRRELDGILKRGEPDTAAETPFSSFRAFMLASPLAETDLELPARDADWRQGAV